MNHLNEKSVPGSLNFLEALISCRSISNGAPLWQRFLCAAWAVGSATTTNEHFFHSAWRWWCGHVLLQGEVTSVFLALDTPYLSSLFVGPCSFLSFSFFSRPSPITSSYTLSQLIAHGLSPTAPVLRSVERYFLKASSFHTLYLIQKITATSYYVLVVHLHLAKHPRSTSEKPKIWTSPLSPS